MSLAWFNGAFADGPLALDPRDRGLLLGDGLFETLLVLNRVALWSNMHFARMESSARELGIGFDRDLTDRGVAEVVERLDDQPHVLRVTLTRGSGVRGLAGNGGNSSLLMTAEPFDKALMFKPVALVTASVMRGMQSIAARMKTLSYIDNIWAAREAKARGVEDALMLNSEGRVASSTIANVFLVKGRKLITPGRDQAILTGVTRQALLAAAARAGFKPEERAVKPQELQKADAVFLTNSLRFIRPVTALDQQALETGDLTPFTEALCEAARLQCGVDPRLI